MHPHAAKIRNFFTEHDCDGEFYLAWPTQPMCIVLPQRPAADVLFATKSHPIKEMLGFEGAQAPCMVLAMAGLPTSDHVEWVINTASASKVRFLGDCDPVDLLIFAFLRSHLRMEYIGVCDSLLCRLGVDLCKNITSEMSTSEKKAMDLVRECVPDLEALVGKSCFEILDSGRRLEQEVLVTCSKLTGQARLDAIAGNRDMS